MSANRDVSQRTLPLVIKFTRLGNDREWERIKSGGHKTAEHVV